MKQRSRKALSWLLSLALVLSLLPGMSLPAYAADTKVTWDENFIMQIVINSHEARNNSFGGITATVGSGDGEEPEHGFANWDGQRMNINNAAIQFASDAGAIKKIVITARDAELRKAVSGWTNTQSEDPHGFVITWEGTASDTVALQAQSANIEEISSIVFTLGEDNALRTVTYDANGATGTVPTDLKSYKKGDEVTVLGITGNLVKDGCTFAGWKDQSGNVYQAGDTFAITRNTTLSAVWNGPLVGKTVKVGDSIDFSGTWYQYSSVSNANTLGNVALDHLTYNGNEWSSQWLFFFNDIESWGFAINGAETPAPVGFKVVGGEGTEDDPYSFALAFVESIPYQAWNKTNKAVETVEVGCADYTEVTSSDEAWGTANTETWYVVNGNITNSNRIEVSGTVNLILCDGATLTAEAGITVQNNSYLQNAPESILNIYAQSAGNNMGALVATGSRGYAGIGGADDAPGTVNIHGGKITATGGFDSQNNQTCGAGIGGSGNAINKQGGVVNIYGGSVTANGASGDVNGGAAGIGGGDGYPSGAGGTVNIYGGTVTANGGELGGTGIGGASSGAGGSVNIYSGTVIANGGYSCAGIGGGFNQDGGSVTINGGNVTATAGSGPNGGYCGAGIGGGAYYNAGRADGNLTVGGGLTVYTSTDNSEWAVMTGDARTRYMKVSGHTHSFTYVASDATVTAICTEGCPYNYHTTGIALMLNAPTDLTYDGSAKAATLSGYPSSVPTGLAAAPKTITYYNSAGEGSTTPDGSALEDAPANAGNYVAQATWGGETASVAFTIAKAAGSISYATATVGKKYGDTAFTNALTNTGDGAVSYESDNTDVAAVNTSTGEVDIVGVGTATITATVADGANYSYATKTESYTLTVGNADMSANVSASGYNGTYDGQSHSITVTAPDDATVKYRTSDGGAYDLTSNPTYTDAGTYTVYYQVTKTNYVPVTGSAEVEISPKSVTVSGITAEKEYDGTTTATLAVTEATFGAGDIVNSDAVTVASATGAFASANADDSVALTGITVTLDGAKAGNYSVSSASGTGKITPKPITGATVTLSATQLVYNGGVQSVGVTGVALESTNLTTSDYDVSGDTTGTNKGNYTVTVTGKGNYKDSATATWEITDKAMTVSASDVTVTYDGQPHGITVNVTDPASGATIKYGNTADDCTLDTSPTITNVSDSPKTVYFQVTADNYATYTDSATITISKASQAAPAAPTLVSATFTDITLTATDGYQYKRGNGEWQDSNVFTGLTMNTEYTFYQRIKDDGNHNDSPESEGKTFKTLNHTHQWTYEVSGATITATCHGDGDCDHKASGVVLTLTAADAGYTGVAYTGASLDANAWTAAGLDVPTIEYVGRGDTSYTKSAAAPTGAGTYTASVTVDTDKTATADFSITKRDIPVTLTVTRNDSAPASCTAALLKADYAPAASNFTRQAEDKFVLSITCEDGYDFTLGCSPDAQMSSFSTDDEAAIKKEGVAVSPQTHLFWVTTPVVEDGGLNLTVTFAKEKTYTILYQPPASQSAVWCKVWKGTGDSAKTFTAKMGPGAVMGDAAVFSLKLTTAFAPTGVAFAATEGALADAGMISTTPQATANWTTNGDNSKFVVIGGDAKTAIAAFVTNGDSLAVYNSDTAAFTEPKNGAGVTYQIVVCGIDGSGNVTSGTVTAPAAPEGPLGFTFGGWKGFKGTAPNQTEELYRAGESISIKENAFFCCVWNPIEVNVTLDLNGGTGGSNIDPVTFGEKLTEPAAPTKAGFTFDCWVVGTDVVEWETFFFKGSPFDFNTKITDDLILKAKWKHVHSYSCYQLDDTIFGDAFDDYVARYKSKLHVRLCGCWNYSLESHSFDSNGVCACGYSKSGSSAATMKVSYGQWVEGTKTYTVRMRNADKTAVKGQEVSVYAPGRIDNLEFSKWQYSTDSGQSWDDLTASTMVSFIIPCNVELRALYVNPVTQPTITLSASRYANAHLDGFAYPLASVIYHMDYKLPDGYTLLDAGVRLGDNAGISYYTLKERKVSVVEDAFNFITSDPISFAYDKMTSEPQYIVEKREDSVLNIMSAQTLADYMYQNKPVNIEQYPPIYWQSNCNTIGQSGSLNVLAPVAFVQKNNGYHYIYGIAFMRYKTPSGQVKTIYTDALATTLNNIPATAVSKSGS